MLVGIVVSVEVWPVRFLAPQVIKWRPNKKAFRYTLKKEVMYYFGIWVKNPVIESTFGWFSLDFDSETSGAVPRFPIRTMYLAKLYPASTAFSPTQSDATPRRPASIKVSFNPVTPIVPRWEQFAIPDMRRMRRMLRGLSRKELWRQVDEEMRERKAARKGGESSGGAEGAEEEVRMLGRGKKRRGKSRGGNGGVFPHLADEASPSISMDPRISIEDLELYRRELDEHEHQILAKNPAHEPCDHPLLCGAQLAKYTNTAKKLDYRSVILHRSEWGGKSGVERSGEQDGADLVRSGGGKVEWSDENNPDNIVEEVRRRSEEMRQRLGQDQQDGDLLIGADIDEVVSDLDGESTVRRSLTKKDAANTYLAEIASPNIPAPPFELEEDPAVTAAPRGDRLDRFLSLGSSPFDSLDDPRLDVLYADNEEENNEERLRLLEGSTPIYRPSKKHILTGSMIEVGDERQKTSPHVTSRSHVSLSFKLALYILSSRCVKLIIAL